MDPKDIFMDEITKVAKIYGALPSKVIGSTHAGIPQKVREAAMEEYVKQKSTEEPTSIPHALLGGAAIGALPGLPFFLAGPIPGLIGTGAGAGLGALGGMIARHYDIKNIEHAKKMVQDAGERAQGLGDMMAHAEQLKTRDLSPSRAALLSYMLHRMDRDMREKE